MDSVRFFAYEKGEWILIILKDKESKQFKEGGPDEEGYSYSYTDYWRENDYVYRKGETFSKDCDGKYEFSFSQKCRVGNLQAIPFEEKGITNYCPNWEEVDSSQRDYSAEAAGY